MRDNPYIRTNWIDNIFDPVANEVIQEGTRFTAERANNIEDGIYNAYERIILNEGDILRLKVQMELDGRVPGSLGSFYDTLSDGDPLRMVREDSMAVLIEPVSGGSEILSVDGTDGLKEFTEVTIYDDENSEDVLVTGITESTITVQELQHDYKKGAVVARSNARIDGHMVNGVWGTYNVRTVN